MFRDPLDVDNGDTLVDSARYGSCVQLLKLFSSKFIACFPKEFMTFRRLCSQPNVVLDLMHLLHLYQRNLDSSVFIGQEFSSRDR